MLSAVLLFTLVFIYSTLVKCCTMFDREDFLREQDRLYKDLKENYNQRLPPVVTNGNFSEGVDLPRYNVTITLMFVKLLRVVETEAKVDFLFDYHANWIDERLKWSPDDYCGITHIYVGLEDVWVPEVSTVETHSSVDFREDYQKFVWVNSTGEIAYFVPTITSTICTFEVQDFPFDKQQCGINLIPLSFSPLDYGYKTELGPYIMTAMDSLGNREWKVTNISLGTQGFHSSNSDFDFEQSIIMFSMERNSAFYLSMIIAPSFVINVLSIVGVFLKSADSMGKLGMALTNIMSLTFVLGILATALPKTEKLPKIGIYVILNLSIMVAALIIVLALPYASRTILTRFGIGEDCKEEKRKRKEEKTYVIVRFGLFVLMELANLINLLMYLVCILMAIVLSVLSPPPPPPRPEENGGFTGGFHPQGQSGFWSYGGDGIPYFSGCEPSGCSLNGGAGPYGYNPYAYGPYYGAGSYGSYRPYEQYGSYAPYGYGGYGSYNYKK